MKFQIDHDLHIHSYISPCAGYDPRQTKEAILAYGLTNQYGLLCVTDHIWDRRVPSPEPVNNWWLKRGLDCEKAKEILPLPQSDKCNFLFGIEADIDYLGNVGISKESYDTFDFIILSPSHLHAEGFARNGAEVGTSAAEYKAFYQARLLQILNMDLPFHKCGIAHFTSCLTCDEGKVAAIDQFTVEEFRNIFGLAAKRGIGIELNQWGFPANYTQQEQESILRPYRIAKKMGCKFYLGGDAHVPEEFAPRKEEFRLLIDALDLTEEDKFPFVKEHMAK